MSKEGGATGAQLSIGPTVHCGQSHQSGCVCVQIPVPVTRDSDVSLTWCAPLTLVGIVSGKGLPVVKPLSEHLPSGHNSLAAAWRRWRRRGRRSKASKAGSNRRRLLWQDRVCSDKTATDVQAQQDPRLLHQLACMGPVQLLLCGSHACDDGRRPVQHLAAH